MLLHSMQVPRKKIFPADLKHAREVVDALILVQDHPGCLRARVCPVQRPVLGGLVSCGWRGREGGIQYRETNTFVFYFIYLSLLGFGRQEDDAGWRRDAAGNLQGCPRNQARRQFP